MIDYKGQKNVIKKHYKIDKDTVNEEKIEKNNNIIPKVEKNKTNEEIKDQKEDNRNSKIEDYKKMDEIMEQKMDNKDEKEKKNKEIITKKGDILKPKKKDKKKLKKNKTEINFKVKGIKIKEKINDQKEVNRNPQNEMKNKEMIEQKIDNINPQNEKKNNNEEIIEQKKDKNPLTEINITDEDITEIKMYNKNPKDEKEKKKEEKIEEKDKKKKLKKKLERNKTDYINFQKEENMNEETIEKKIVNKNTEIVTKKNKDNEEIKDNINKMIDENKNNEEKIMQRESSKLKKEVKKKIEENKKVKINEEKRKYNEDNGNSHFEIKNLEKFEQKIDNKNLKKKKNKKNEEKKEEDNENQKGDDNKIDNKEIIKQKDDKKIKKSINLMNPKKVIKKRAPSAQIFKNINNKRKNNLYKKLNICSFFPNKNENKISIPGLIGLMNIGATCYMNATLQCFSNIPKLREYLMEKKTYYKLKKYQATYKLSFALAEVIKNLWENLDKRFYPPENFKNVISEMNPLFKGIAANDPKDLILFLLENIHKELNSHKNNKDNKDNNHNFSLFNNNFIEEYNCFRQSYINKNKSIVSDEFYGFNNTITSCGNCQFTINNIQVYNILFFPLEEIRKYKNYTDNNVKIIDCFEYHTKIDYNQEFYCNSCGQNCGSISQTKLINVPHTLIFNLNRGKGLEYNVNILFDEYLNLNKYINDENSPYYYELIGVICHFGSNDMGGHFIAFCKNYNNCEWYKYNDQIVTKCLFNEVKQSGLPYVLFYNYVQTYDKIND